MATTSVVSSITRFGTIEPWDVQVARNQITQHQYVFVFGQAPTVTTQQSVWATTGTYAYLASASALQISSGSANDAAAGTGARTVYISGLDASYNAISETVILNGQTQVATTQSFLRVNDFYVLTAGSGNTQAGIIYAGTGSATAGVPATVYSLMPVGYNTQTQGIYTVPAGYTAYISSYTFTSNNTTANTICSGLLFVYKYGSAFPIVEATARFNAGNIFDRHFDYPLQIAAKTDLELRVSAGASGQMTGEMHILLIKNDGQS